MKIHQELWNDSPCSRCQKTPCCRNLPLLPFRMESQKDFINLLLVSTYKGVFPALKDSLEWTIYLSRKCSYLEDESGKCAIHTEAHQSLICKTYNAHTCWYVDAFHPEDYTTMIPFNTERLIWLEKRYSLIRSRFDFPVLWKELCQEVRSEGPSFSYPSGGEPFLWNPRRLPFKNCHSSGYLFFPPYKRPGSRNHFELLSFRLGFPGVSLAVSDTCWAFLIQTSQIPDRLEAVRQEYYPAIAHKDGAFSFDSFYRDMVPFSETGEQWVVLNREDLPTLINLTLFDPAGRVKRLPRCSEVLSALNKAGPHRAAEQKTSGLSRYSGLQDCRFPVGSDTHANFSNQ